MEPEPGVAAPEPAPLRLPRADRLTAAYRARRTAYRLRARLMCVSGLHRWALHRNPEVSGRLAMYHLCRRCGREKNVYGRPASVDYSR